MPDVEAVISAELDYKLAVAGADVRKFVASAVEGLELTGPLGDAVPDLIAAVDEAERASGRPLDAANDKGWQVFSARLAEIEKKYGLADKAKVRDQAVFDMYKKHLASLKATVEEDVDKARRADGLEYIKTDLAAMKPKLV
jgi:hypothetical protein